MDRNQRLDELMTGLRETLESLPDDGQEHRVEIQVGPNNRGNVAGGNQYILKLGPDEPSRPEASRTCPQCLGGTWLATRECMHCEFDLWAHDHMLALKAISHRMLRTMIISGAAGFALLWGASYLPQPFSMWVALAGIVSLGLACVAMQRGEAADKQLRGR